MVDLAWKMMLADRLRFLITVAGVAFAVTLVLTQVGLFLGLLDNASITIDHLPADLWVTSRNTPNVDFAHQFPEGYVDRVRSIPGVARADNLLVTFMEIALPTGATEGTLVYAMDDFGAWGFPWRIAEGQPAADLRRGSAMILDDSATGRYGPFKVGDHREILGRRLRIIARSRDARSFTTTPIAFLDYHRAQAMNPGTLGGKTSYIVARLEPGASIDAVKAAIRQRLPYNDGYTKDEWAARSRSYWVRSTGIGLSMAVTVTLGLLVGIVVVAQTLYTSTMEHLKEFGTVKAIGGSNGDIYRILSRQATAAAVIGFALALVPSYGAMPIVSHAGLKLIIPVPLTGVVFAGTLVMCLLAALVSFRKVAAIDPALVFRT
ncbi:MAG: ABC transporter permease [Acidobacteriota bacterium]